MQDVTQFLSNHPQLTIAAAIVFVLLVIIEFIRARRNVFNLTPAKMTYFINRENAVVIDIRAKETFREGHIIDAVSLQAPDIAKNPKKLDKYRARPLIIVANSGNDSQKIASLLLKNGYNAYSLTGGMRAWMEAQMPLIKG